MHSRFRKFQLIAVALCAVSPLVLMQPASACDMHGEFGFHRMNPFLAMRQQRFDEPLPRAESDIPNSTPINFDKRRAPEFVTDSDVRSSDNDATTPSTENEASLD